LRKAQLRFESSRGLACPTRGLNMLAASSGASLGRAKDAMLDFLFRRLTAADPSGFALFSAATREARQLHWYRDGGVADTVDGRFGVLSTVMALILVRLEQGGESGNALSVALTERFIAVMESEHRELGLGDPTLGKTVRKLVGRLARRNALWRETISGAHRWDDAVQESLGVMETGPTAHDAAALKALWTKLEGSSLAALGEGRIG
jgi:cytochrome b pre-mRNA-processing protein 3